MIFVTNDVSPMDRPLQIVLFATCICLQRCSNCYREQAIARKQCTECGTNFFKVKKSLESLKEKGQTNISQQRHLMEMRVSLTK